MISIKVQYFSQYQQQLTKEDVNAHSHMVQNRSWVLDHPAIQAMGDFSQPMHRKVYKVYPG